MKNRKLAALFHALVMVLSMGLAAHAQDVTELPRNETLYFGGQQWGTVNSWNPVGANQNNAMATTANAQGSRTIMFETLYMYNFMDGSMKPLLAEGEPRLERCPDRSDREDQPRRRSGPTARRSPQTTW